MNRLAVTVIAGVLAASLLSRADAQATNTSSTTGPGFAFLYGDLVGEAPTGMTVYVAKGTTQRHSSLIASYAKPAIAQMAKLGLPISYAGYYTKAPSGTGVITVTESNAGCGSGAKKNQERSGYTDTRIITTPAPAYVDHSFIYICPAVFKVALPKNYAKLSAKQRKTVKAKATAATTHNTQATVVHELGHSVGLGHTAYKVGGKYQVMYPEANEASTSYGSGDQAGIRQLAAGSVSVKLGAAPTLTFAPSDVNAPGDTVTVTGTATLAFFPGATVHITISVTPTGGATTIVTADSLADGSFSLTVPKAIPADYAIVATSSLSATSTTTRTWNYHFA